MTTTIGKVFSFEAAHQLPNHDGKCANLHGHTYKVEVVVVGFVNASAQGGPKEGMLLDFGIVSGLFKEKVFSRLDHQFLNEVPGLDIPVTTAEYLAQWIFGELEAGLHEEKYCEQVKLGNARVLSIKVWETQKSWAEYRRRET